MESLIELLETSTRQHEHQTALAMCRGLSTDLWSYARLWQAAQAAAAYLADEAGVHRGKPLLVLAPNSPELVALCFGCMLAGIVIVPMDEGSTDAFVSQVAAVTGASVLIVGPTVKVANHAVHVLPLSAVQFDCAPAHPLPRPRAEDAVEIVFTSGTTGTPKGVVLTHANILANVRSGELSGVLPRTDRYRLLSLLPLSHMFEQTAGLYMPLSYGASVTYVPTRQPSTVLRALRRRHITGIVAVPLVLDLLWRGIEREARRRGDLRRWQVLLRAADYLPLRARRLLFASVHSELGGRFEFFLCGGAHLASAIETDWERLGIRVIQGYGATECSPVIAANTFKHRVPGSVGRPVPEVQVRLSAEGEVQIRGANVTGGYWNDPVGTRAAFTSDGWYRSGDLAEVTKTGELVLRGRLRDLIVLPNGLNVYPEDVEQALDLEQQIAESVVIGVPDRDRGGLRLHALIVPSETVSDATQRPQLDAAVRRANARLAPHQRVIDYSVRKAESLPRTSSGKIKRHALDVQPSGGHTAISEPGRTATTDKDRSGRIARLVAEVAHVPADSIALDADLSLDLHIDSLGRVEMAVHLEEELGVSVDEGAITEMHTVADLVELAAHAERSQDSGLPFPRWALTRSSRVVRHVVQATVLFPLHTVVCRPFAVWGAEHVTGLSLPALFVANHTSHFDTPTLLRALPPAVRERTTVAAAADYFYQDRRLGIAASLLLNTFPFSREHAVRASLEYCAELVDAGWSILLYPEGTRSTTGRLQAFKTGMGLLARELRLPVVPVAVHGTRAILPKGRWLPRPGPVSVRFGTPVLPVPGLDAAALTDLLEHALQECLALNPVARDASIELAR